MDKKNILIKNLQKVCQTCNGTTMLIWTARGPMYGWVKPCPDCVYNYKNSINLYGSQDEDLPDVYIDAEKGILQTVKKDAKSIIIGGKEIEISSEIKKENI